MKIKKEMEVEYANNKGANGFDEGKREEFADFVKLFGPIVDTVAYNAVTLITGYKKVIRLLLILVLKIEILLPTTLAKNVCSSRRSSDTLLYELRIKGT